MSNSKFQIPNFQAGQTLIETMAAMFILVMGLTAAVGLAIYALNSSTNVVKQIVATGLAREGLEAVRNMRDTNWLQQTAIDNNCYDFTNATNDAPCYTHWLNQMYCLDPSGGNGCSATTGNYAVGFNYTFGNPNFWNLLAQPASGGSYGLTFDPANSGTTGFYSTGASGVQCADGASANGFGISDYCRKIIITKQTPAGSPYDPATYGGANNPGPLLFVQAEVWWVGQKCPRAADYSSASPTCRVELDTYLTNWKNY